MGVRISQVGAHSIPTILLLNIFYTNSIGTSSKASSQLILPQPDFVFFNKLFQAVRIVIKTLNCTAFGQIWPQLKGF